MLANLRIRRMDEEMIANDFSHIADLLAESYETSFGGQEFSRGYFLERAQKLHNYIVDDMAVAFGAFSHQLIGLLWAYRRSYLEGERLHINHLVVSTRYRGLGLGRDLLRAAENYARCHGMSAIDLMVTAGSASVDFYRHCGFEIERYQMRVSVK